METISLTALVLLAFAAYRVTRLIVIDAVFEEPREWFIRRLGFKKNKDGEWFNRESRLAEKFIYLITCTWCTGVWVSIFIYWFWSGELDFIPIAAIAGVQGMLHAVEPDGDS